MSLKDAYKSYLANPGAGLLAEKASLNYITTLTTINTAAAIVKHNTAQQKTLKKKEEKIIGCIEGSDAVCLDVETTLEFLTGGGAYLPGLDDNFVADRVVTFPMVHIVHFDADLKIQQIRLYWDQGSLLKLVDVIGARARNWPIRDGKDQARLIASSVAGTNQHNGPLPPAANKTPTDPTVAGKPRSQSNNVTRDPHASLSLFAPREESDDSSAPAVQATRTTSKPPPRDYHDLFVGNDSDASPQAKGRANQQENTAMRPPKAQSAKPPPRDYHDLFVSNDDGPVVPRDQAGSPKRDILSPGPVAGKGGSGKNYKPSRLFDMDDDEPGTPKSPGKGYKAHPQKYNHFQFGDGEDSKPVQPNRINNKHQSQWGFEDFMTPQKPPMKIRDQDKRHFGFEDDEPVMDSPAKHPAIPKARPDATSNFEFQDDGTPAGARRPAGQPRGQGTVRTTGLYQDNLFGDGETPPSPEKKGNPLAPVTNLKDRSKHFDPNFSMTDSSPSHGTENRHPMTESRTKVVSQMNAQWDTSDVSPPTAQQTQKSHPDRSNDKENNFGQPRSGNNGHIGIKSGGDGMGGKKGAGRQWGFGDESDEDGAGGVNGGKYLASRKQQGPKENGFWDF